MRLCLPFSWYPTSSTAPAFLAKRGVFLGVGAAGWFQVLLRMSEEQTLHPALLQAWLKPSNTTIEVHSCPRICLVSLTEPVFYSSCTLVECSLESCSADFVIFLTCILCSSVFIIPQRRLYFDNTFSFSDLRADGFPGNLPALILKPTSLWTFFVW